MRQFRSFIKFQAIVKCEKVRKSRLQTIEIKEFFSGRGKADNDIGMFLYPPEPFARPGAYCSVGFASLVVALPCVISESILTYSASPCRQAACV